MRPRVDFNITKASLLLVEVDLLITIRQQQLHHRRVPFQCILLLEARGERQYCFGIDTGEILTTSHTIIYERSEALRLHI